jgi:hypothetical protein
MEFVHLSPRRITAIKNPKQLGTSFKPKGCLWFSCGDAWEQWMAAEGFQPKEPYKFKYKATLDLEKLLILKTISDIERFTRQFGIPDKDYPTFFIDWNKVRKETGKSGLFVVNGNLKTARKKFAWYSSLDGCSVAIWKNDAILRMTETQV